MNDPRMSRKQRNQLAEEVRSEEREEQDDREAPNFRPWAEETIVVNGQPMTVTFPMEED